MTSIVCGNTGKAVKINKSAKTEKVEVNTRGKTVGKKVRIGTVEGLADFQVRETPLDFQGELEVFRDSPDRKKTFILPNNDKLLEMPVDMKKILVGNECVKYIRESILAFRELIGGTVPIVDMLLHCSYCNHNFSVATLAQIQEQISTAPVNELKPVFAMLLDMLLMEDPLQKPRLKCAVEGNSNDGLLETIRNGTQSDSRRSYQCIKFLVHLSNKCPLAKDYLMSISSRWQWAVNWLKKKMTEYYWTPQSSISNESSTGKTFQRTMSAQDTLAEATALLTELNTKTTTMTTKS